MMTPIAEAECVRQMDALTALCAVHQRAIDRAQGAAQVLATVGAAVKELRPALDRVDATVQALRERLGEPA